ncbi:MAG TPA: VOC family protein [Actinomycetota bacterium]|nr:VOC family protein [Actinomycetota bacterium]
MLGQEARLVYLYVGSADVESDLGFYRDQLGAEVAWRAQAFGADVAAVRLGEGPLLLLADHEPAPSVLCIWAVTDLDAAVAELRSRGWAGDDVRVEVPDGTCLVLSDPSGNRLGLLLQTRPNAMQAHRPGS